MKAIAHGPGGFAEKYFASFRGAQMFKPTISVLLFFWVSSVAAAPFTPWQQNQVLSALENYCGNAWCEGDFQYQFQHLQCNSSSHSCRLAFTLVKRGTSQRKQGTCEYSPVSSFHALLSSEGGPDSLNDSFLEALDNCFEKLEHQFGAAPAR